MSKARETIRQDAPVREPIRAEEGERVRMRRGSQTIDPFHIPHEMLQAVKESGTSVEFKRHEVYGQVDYSYQRSLGEQGWRPAPHSMFPGLFAPVGTEGPIVVEGMMLMERPLRLTEEAKHEELSAARQAVRIGEKKITEAPEGTADRTGARICKSIERMSVPD